MKQSSEKNRRKLFARYAKTVKYLKEECNFDLDMIEEFLREMEESLRTTSRRT